MERVDERTGKKADGDYLGNEGESGVDAGLVMMMKDGVDFGTGDAPEGELWFNQRDVGIVFAVVMEEIGKVGELTVLKEAKEKVVIFGWREAGVTKKKVFGEKRTVDHD